MHPRKQHNPNTGKRKTHTRHKPRLRQKQTSQITSFHPGKNDARHYIELYKAGKISYDLFAAAHDYFKRTEGW